jgi:hypothetical protein
METRHPKTFVKRLHIFEFATFHKVPRGLNAFDAKKRLFKLWMIISPLAFGLGFFWGRARA